MQHATDSHTSTTTVASERDLALSILFTTERARLQQQLALVDLAERYANLRVISDEALVQLLTEVAQWA